MTFQAIIIADSVSPVGKRLITLQLVFPRFILPEFNTHRVFSRNASSSRAIPVKKMIELIKSNPASPAEWGKNQPGMQAGEELSGEDLKLTKDLWAKAASSAIQIAEEMNQYGAHKQIINRILEPFQWANVIVTSTEWDNFFELRNHKDAQPEIRILASRMLDAMNNSIPKNLDYGNWHLPFINSSERIEYSEEHLLKMSTARCARVSYLTHEGKAPSLEDDLKLYERLVGSKPIHASPTEHQAKPNVDKNISSGNFKGWIQYRKTIK